MSRDLNKIMEIMKLASLPEYEMQIQRMMYLQEHEEYMVSFMGQFSAGKSYLINNLIGKSVLPVHRSETTALITFVKYDQNERVEIIYKDGTNSEKGLEAVNELWESGNKEELEQIETLFVYVNADLLKNGLVLADTPGVNTLISEHEALTRETLQSSDKIVYVMGKAAAEEDLNFVKNIRMNGIQTIFVRTHMDCLNDTEEDPNKTIEEQEKILAPYTNDPIFFVSNEKESAYYKDLENLQKYLRDKLGTDIHKTIENTIEERTGFILEKLQENLQKRKEELQEYLLGENEKYTEEKNGIEEAIEILRGIIDKNSTEIDQKYQVNCQQSKDELEQNIVDGKKKLSQKIDQMLKSGDDIKNLNEKVEKETSKECRNILDEYVYSFDGFIKKNREELLRTLAESCPKMKFDQDIPEDIDGVSDKASAIKDQINYLQAQTVKYEEEIANLQSEMENGQVQIEEQEQKKEKLQQQYQEYKKQLEEYPKYEPKIIIEEYHSDKNEKTFATVGKAIDWALILVPGASWEKVTQKTLVGAGKIAQKIPAAKKIGDKLKKTGEIVKGAGAFVKETDTAVDTTRIVDKFMSQNEDGDKKGIGKIMDRLSVEYYLRNLGKKLDHTEITKKVDLDYENEYKRKKEVINRNVRLKVHEEIKRREKILEIKSEVEKKQLEEQVMQRESEKAKREIEELEEKLNKEKEKQKQKLWGETLKEQLDLVFSQGIQNAVKMIDTELDARVEEYKEVLNIGIIKKLQDRKKQLEEIEQMYKNESREKMLSQVEEIDEALKYCKEA